MTAATIAPTLTVHHFLFGEGGDTGQLAELLRQRAVTGALDAGLRALSHGGRGAVDQTVASVASRLLQVDLGGILLAGWRKHSALLAAGRATAADPHLEQVVDLATHRVTFVQRPHVDVLLDGAPIARLGVELQLVFQITGLAAVVHTGRIRALRSGRSELVASLGVADISLAERRAELDLRLLVPIGDGIALT